MSWMRRWRRGALQTSAQTQPPEATNLNARQRLSRWDEARLAKAMALVNDQSQPNLNALVQATRNLDIMALNVKSMGYDLARALAAANLNQGPPPPARRVGLGSRLSTQADVESDWMAHWCGELKIPVVYHRKLWEFAYLFQVLHDADLLRAGVRGVGFGCGTEPVASYLASREVSTTITDLAPEDRRSEGWAQTNEHAPSLDHAYHEALVDRAQFNAHVTHRYVDMNAIPDDLVGYDFCWSICALEHLGSISQGLDFIVASLDTLRPGGTAVHTTEFNVNPDGPTIDNWPTVLFQRRHIEELVARLETLGHRVAAVNFDSGSAPLDRFIDIPPWRDAPLGPLSTALGQHAHLKMAVDGFVATCIGLTITRGA